MGAFTPPITFSDGQQVQLRNTTLSMNGVVGQHGLWRSYDNTQARDSRITHRHRLALFHYVTRSLQDYTEKKHHGVAGSQSTAYLVFCEKHNLSPDDPQVLRSYEQLSGYDSDAPVCSSATWYHPVCCKAQGE